MLLKPVFGHLLLFLVLFAASSCDDKQEVDTTLPANITADVTIDPDGTGHVLVEVYAENAVEYQLRIGINGPDAVTNTTGIFEHTFIQSGTYTLDVRAYGSSGRYLKLEIPITVIISDDEVSPEDGYITPLFYEGYDLVWNDEFEGSAVDPAYWVFETGNGCPNLCGWGNNELQYYREENAWVEDGILTIEARRETVQTNNYTSARMKTQGKKSFKYGRVDIRALLPKGQGIWPALWMLGNNITTVGWPKCGEIDIMEMIGGSGRENQVHGTLHWDNNGHNYTGGTYTLPSGVFADEYHVFTILWDQTSIKWLVNDEQFHEILITPAHMTEFHEEFFFLFNIAVGGNWPGNPNESTVFPQQMKVDYIRVFQPN